MNRVVVFDLDGTLADSMDAYGRYASQLISSTYLISLTEATRRYFVTAGRPFLEQLNIMFPGSHLNNFVAQDFSEFKHDYQQAIHLYDDAEDACRVLKDSGCTLGVCSSTNEDLVRQLIQRSAVWHLMEYVTGHDGRALSKQVQLERFKRNLELPVTFVGDTLYDAEVAKAAGVDFLGVAHTISRREFHDENVSAESTLLNVAQRIVKNG